MIKFIKSRKSFTDRLYFANLIFTWAFTLVCILITLFGANMGIMDYSIVSVGLPTVWAELSVHTGFVVTKARIENLAKHNKLEDTDVSQM